MKKRVFLIAVLSLFLVAVTGCNNEETPPNPPVGETDTLERIEVSGGTRTFTVGTDFSVGDLVVKAIYSESGEKVLTSSDYKVDASKVDKAKTGIYEIVVSYDDKQTKYTVTYEEKKNEINHQAAFVVEKPEGAVTRPFNEAFDTTINDFSSATLVGTTSNGVYDATSTLRVLVDNEAEGAPVSPDASIYKMATGTYDLASVSNIGFKMKVVSGTLDYSNLVLALRGDDAYNVFEISLAEALDEDGEALPNLSNEYQEILISPNLSIEDADTEYKLAATGENSGVKVLSKILGFHLYAKGECSAVLEIKEVFFTLAGEKTILDKFDRQAVNKTDDTCWWRDSTGFIVLPNILLNDGATYTTPTVAVGENTQLVVSLLGDTNGLSIAPIVNGTTKTAIPWASLKNKDGEALSHAVNGAFFPYAVDLEQSGLLEDGLEGFVFTSTTGCAIADVFYSSLKEKEALKEYPHIDSENVVIFDNFNRTQATIDPSYDASILNEKVLDAGLNYFICYSGQDKVSVDGDALVFAPQDGYTQVAIGSTRGCANHKYMVIVAKVDEGNLNDFRIGGFGSIVYANQWLAGEGLKTIPEDMTTYPYVTSDGYVWYIIDLELSNMPVKDQLDLYYTGEGTLSIDSIFFANESLLAEWVDLRTTEETISTEAGYKYLSGGKNSNGMKYCMELKGDGVVTFESFRFALGNQPAIWLKDTLKAYYADGTAVAATDVIPTEPTKIYIDLIENGFVVEAGDFHLHWGDYGDITGSITLLTTSVLVPTKYSANIAGNIDLDITADAAYQYVGNNTQGLPMLKFVVIGDGAVTLESFRLQVEGQGDYIWANNGLVLLKEDGSVYDYTQAIPAEETTFYVDLAASGLEIFNNHIHMFVGGSGVGALTIKTVEGVSDTLPYSVILSAFDEVIPTPVETPQE